MVWPSTNYNTVTWSGNKCDTMIWGRLPFVSLSFGYSTKCNNILALYRSKTITATTTNTDAKCNTVVHDNTSGTKYNYNNDWSYPGNGTKCVSSSGGRRWQISAPNAFPDSLFINLLCTHAVFERSTDREWHNPYGTSDGRGDPWEQICLGTGNSKTRTLHQQLTIIYCFMLRLHKGERESKPVRVYEQTQRDTSHLTKLSEHQLLIDTSSNC